MPPQSRSYLVWIAKLSNSTASREIYCERADTRAMHKTSAKFNDVNHNVTTTRHDKLSRRIRTQICTLDKSSCPQNIPAVYLHTNVHRYTHTSVFASGNIIASLAQTMPIDKLLLLSLQLDFDERKKKKKKNEFLS